MKNLFALLFVFLIISCSADSESVSGCECEKQVYKYTTVGLDGITPQWGYLHQYNEYDSSLDCSDASDEFNFMGNNLYYKVVCE